MQLHNSTAAAEVASERLALLLPDILAGGQIKNVLVAVQRGDRSLSWIGAAGAASPDGTPMGAATPFHIASISKLMIAVVVLKLYENGKLQLDAPLAAYLPQSLIGGLHRRDGVDYTPRLTVRHLLGHTSGLADCFEDRPRGGMSLMQRLFIEGDRGWAIDDLAQIVRDELIPHFPPQPTDAKRQRVRYSDTNYQLLNAIIEALTGQALHQVLEELLFRPLELRHTFLFGRSQPLAPTPEPATLWHGTHPVALPQALASFVSIYSTAPDCLTFLRALMGGAVLQPATLTLMQQRWNRFGFPLDPAALRAPGWPIEYGLGMMRFRLPRLFTPLRPLPAVLGHSGSTGVWLFYCPQLDLYLCGTVNQATAGSFPYRFVPKLLRMLQG